MLIEEQEMSCFEKDSYTQPRMVITSFSQKIYIQKSIAMCDLDNF